MLRAAAACHLTQWFDLADAGLEDKLQVASMCSSLSFESTAEWAPYVGSIMCAVALPVTQLPCLHIQC